MIGITYGGPAWEVLYYLLRLLLMVWTTLGVIAILRLLNTWRNAIGWNQERRRRRSTPASQLSFGILNDMTFEEYVEEKDTWYHWREIMKTTPTCRRLTYREWRTSCPREWGKAHREEVRYYR